MPGIIPNCRADIAVPAACVWLLLTQTIGVYGRVENQLHEQVLGRFWAKSFGVFAGACGAASTTVNLARVALASNGSQGSHAAEVAEPSDVVTWVGRVALLVGLAVTYLAALVALTRHRADAAGPRAQ